ncbi:hypothetical protein AC249_AIPGENE28885 [Exaiptasia diaphana]|nr:hypothetical protein AC249_AIPGENE28885 [Exaiptasia diaphana]
MNNSDENRMQMFTKRKTSSESSIKGTDGFFGRNISVLMSQPDEIPLTNELSMISVTFLPRPVSCKFPYSSFRDE